MHHVGVRVIVLDVLSSLIEYLIVMKQIMTNPSFII